MTAVAVAFPFIILLVLTLAFRRPLWQGGIAALASALVAWSFVPGIETGQLVPPLVRAFVVATEVGLILLGAIAFLEYMSRIGTTGRIQSSLAGFTNGDRALNALLLAWLFCGFLEGAAGFGAPAALVAPLLSSLGFSPLGAAALPLIGDSAAVPFGAVGTPVRVGFDGMTGAEQAGHYGAGLNLLIGWIPPLFIFLLVRTFDRLKGNTPEHSTGPGLALWAGFCYSIPAFGLVWLGPEFPSLAGSLVGIGLFSMTLAIRRGQKAPNDSTPRPSFKNLIIAFSPYLLLCLFLLGGKALLGSSRLRFDLAGSQESIGLFQPGLLFLVTIALLVILRKKESLREMFRLIGLPAKRLPGVWLAIFCMASQAQFTVRLSNPADALGVIFDGSSGATILILMAPLAGTLGSFITGSATVSNLLCAPFLVPACALTGADPGLVLGLQLIGAGAGNMISLQNLVAVQATVGLVNREADMLKLLWRPCLAYVTAASILGWVISLLL
jgi:lactate permease